MMFLCFFFYLGKNKFDTQSVMRHSGVFWQLPRFLTILQWLTSPTFPAVTSVASKRCSVSLLCSDDCDWPAASEPTSTYLTELHEIPVCECVYFSVSKKVYPWGKLSNLPSCRVAWEHMGVSVPCSGSELSPLQLPVHFHIFWSIAEHKPTTLRSQVGKSLCWLSYTLKKKGLSQTGIKSSPFFSGHHVVFFVLLLYMQCQAWNVTCRLEIMCLNLSSDLFV